MGQAEQDKQKVHAEQDRQNRINGTGQAGQDRQDRTSITGQAKQD
jgi:hypothetical protein